MSRLRTLLAFFSCPADRQIEILEHLPRDRGAADFYTGLGRNPLLRLVHGLGDEAVQDDDEPWPDFLSRSSLPEDTSRTALSELVFYSDLLSRSLCAEDYWTQRALRDKTAWRLFRRLAAQTLSDLGWTADCSADEVRALVRHYQTESTHA
jgi:hypothetical protein